MKAKNIFLILILYIILIFIGYGIGYYIGNVKALPINPMEDSNSINRSLKEPETKIITGDIDYNKNINGLMALKVSDYDFLLDLRYATENNFSGKKVYDAYVCVLQQDTLKKLIAANEDFKALGYRIKIWDAYRPASVQEYFWGLVQDRRYIASPYHNGSRHNRGTAVDITLVDKDGKELEMPTGFDEFNSKAHRNNNSSNTMANRNVNLLTEIMLKNGFSKIETEWWHFDDSEADSYPIQNEPLSRFLVNVE
ncbi:M15 family metallopeptidase [Clostridium sp. MSJ-4]|uniref:D-alanyl-D-alanine dipeptidase n=1 Tax=Clostridium simiarum TaxID=2841506 RepID=A0ABS6F1S6_9CLOT|nr:M15 family metallopeptidase [Clostridium simiarum]MBU5592469.1 M15 family metallopeptidase [Clostridium simiarum]